MSFTKILLCALLIVLILSGFKDKVRESGYVKTNEAVHAGLTKEQVLKIMGNPSVVSDISGNWYYIHTTFTKDILGVRKYISSDVVEISFKNNKINNVKNTSVSKRSLPKINSDASFENKRTLKQSIIEAIKNLSPSL